MTTLEHYKQNRITNPTLSARIAWYWAKEAKTLETFDLKWKEVKNHFTASINFKGLSFEARAEYDQDFDPFDDCGSTMEESLAYFRRIMSKHNAWLAAKKDIERQETIKKNERDDYAAMYLQVWIKDQKDLFSESVGGVTIETLDDLKQFVHELMLELIHAYEKEKTLAAEYAAMC